MHVIIQKVKGRRTLTRRAGQMGKTEEEKAANHTTKQKCACVNFLFVKNSPKGDMETIKTATGRQHRLFTSSGMKTLAEQQASPAARHNKMY